MRIAIAGASGRVGVPTGEIARARGHDVVALTRADGVDLVTGAGVEAALGGVDVVIDVTNRDTRHTRRSVDFFTSVTTTLLDAEVRAGVRHHVALSIVGIDGQTSGYYAGKLAQEAGVQAGPVPWTLLRTTQFHEFAAQIWETAAVGPIHLAPRMRTQPIAAREVASRLVDLAEGRPRGRARDLAGPHEESLVTMVRAYGRAIGRPATRWRVPAVSLPGAFGRWQRDGSALPGPDAMLGEQTFAEWLDETRAAR
ncbi:SDR family oxidoreductase [Microbacterium chocolatum]|uniref:SDR family oxidoreductase n=1 Tax=Microbacterium aurantiacum TaxID=162393 RepID=UPI00338F86E3